MIISCLKTTFKKITPKKFWWIKFLHDLDQQLIKVEFYKEKNKKIFRILLKQTCTPQGKKLAKEIMEIIPVPWTILKVHSQVWDHL